MKNIINNKGIQFHPRQGSVLICDFAGNLVPEIVKKRPVVVVSRIKRPGLVMVVPLSSTAPEKPVDYVIKLSKNYLNPQDETIMYAKCDLVCSVSFKRLDRIKVGYRKYTCPMMDKGDFSAIIKGIKFFLDF